MALLNAGHIDHIIKDLNYRGIILEGFQDEVIDHVCSAVEAEMDKGKNFIEAYHEVLKSFGHTAGLRAMQKQTLQVENKTTTIMLKNFLTIAIRNLRKHRFFTFINILGLAIGIASCLVIVLFVTNELSYDRYHANAKRIYRVNSEIKFGANHWKLATGNAPIAELLFKNYPGIESVLRFRYWGPRFVRKVDGTDPIKENVVWADSSFFTFFSVPILQGNAKTALQEPNSVAISRKMADKYFPQGNAVGQSLILDKDWNHKVTAVYENIPNASHFHFDMLTAMSGLEEARSVTLISGGDFHTYLLLSKGTDPKALEAKLPGFVQKYVAPQIAAVMGGDFTMEKFRTSGNFWEYTLTPMLDIHLHSALLGEFEPNGNITYVYLFSAIAFFILVIACINFMNLSTARSANRAKEVGLRKVMGSLRSHLVRQFLTESFLLSLLSFVMAVLIAYLFLPTFNNLAQKELTLPWRTISFYGILFLSSTVVGLLAGLYPAFFLSAFQPVNVLKGKLALGMKSGFIRSGLVVFQFVVSILLIIGTITVNRQLNYIQNKKLGFVRDQVIVVKEAQSLGDKIQSFKEEVLRNNLITHGTISGYLPVSGTWRSNDTFWGEGVQPSQESINDMVSIQKWTVDYDYVKTLGMNVKLGRNFSAEFPSDSTAIIMNEAAVNKFNFGNDAIGKKISTFNGSKPDGTPDPDKIKSWTVVGVVEDFHFESLKENITPLAFFLERSNGNVAFRFEAANTQDVISAIERIWKRLAPGQPFTYSFLDEDFGRMYVSEQRLGKIFALFAGLAIIIACLGLFALTAFTAEQRTKEIGIRKVLGASISSIVVLLSQEFGKLILIAFVLATPVAWFAIARWLQDYAYKVNIGWGTYAVAGLLALAVTWITMGYQSIKAATANPVNSLRSE